MPQNDTPDYLAPFKQRRQRNLAYFEKFYPGVHKHFKNRELVDVDLIVKPSRNDVDLEVDGESLYQGRARAIARHEVKMFCAKYDSGATMNAGVRPFFPSADNDSPFAARSMAEIARQSPLTADDFYGYRVDGYFPMMVFMGCGLGYHIEQILEKRDIQKVIVFEPNAEIFAASLFAVDWKQICSGLWHKGGEIQFHINVGIDEQTHEDALTTLLTKSLPLHPGGSQYFVHKGSGDMRRILTRINQDFQTNLTARGGYDDFVLRFNNAVHFYDKKIPAIPPKNSIQSKKPVVIAGSGPSIDDRIEDIRAVREHVLLVTAGTGLDGLLANGIRPDVHLEIDPHYMVYRRHNLNSANVKDIRFLGSPDVYPYLWDVFGESRIYNPHANPVAPLFGSETHQIRGTAPTCTNAAIAVFSQLGYSQIFLFGTDYGFRKHDQHHSIHSAVYSSDDAKIQDANKNYGDTQFTPQVTFEVESVDGKTCYTNRAFHLAKVKAEDVIKDTHDKNVDARFYNCSDGAHIEGAKWLSGTDFMMTVKALPQDDDGLDTLFSRNARFVSPTNAERQINDMSQLLHVHTSNILKIVNGNPIQNKKDITKLSIEIVNYFDSFTAGPKGRGSTIRRLAAGLTKDEMINFLVLGFTHAMALNDADAKSSFLESWKNGFSQFLKELPENFQTNTDKAYLHML